MKKRTLYTTPFAGLVLAGFTAAGCTTIEETIDPDCTPDKAARNAATQATIGLPSNRCSPAETARDVAGVDG